MHGPPLPQVGGIRDPFAWKEVLTPGHSPVVSARNSRAGSRAGGSNASTPRSATPPLSPAYVGSARYADPGSARSSVSGNSARSFTGSARGGYTPTEAEAYVTGGYTGGGAYDGLSARTSAFYTPEPSARSSDFLSVYDANSARNVDFLYSEESLHHGSQVAGVHEAGTGRRKHRAMAAALDAFVPSKPAPPPPPSTLIEGGPEAEEEASIDPKVVYSSARHGRHKEVEASLQAGFDPNFADSFGNTLFHVACQNGNKRIAKLAIKYGGDMDAQNVKGHTGLHFLFSYGYPDIAEYFISKGADETIINESGKTAREGIR